RAQDLAADGLAQVYGSYVIGQAYHAMGRYQEAVVQMERAMAGLHHLDPFWLHRAEIATGQLYAFLGDSRKSRDLYIRGIAGAESVGNIWLARVSLVFLGDLEIEQNNLASAKVMLEECLGFVRKIGDRRTLAACLDRLGRVAAAEGRP